MKKIFTLVSLTLVGSAFAQTWVHDTVTVGNNYVDRVFYSLENGEAARYDNFGAEADLIIPTQAFTQEIYVAYGASLFEVLGTAGDSSNWASFTVADPATIVDGTDYKRLVDAADSYDGSAFAQGSAFYGWGEYSGAPLHAIVGTRIFLIKTSSGVWKKVYIITQIPESGVSKLKIRFADLDGSNETDVIIEKNNSARSSKNFIYYDIDADNVENPEPDAGNYDLVFTRWNEFIGSYMAVSGVINAPGVYASISSGHADIAAADLAKYSDNPILDSSINVIGTGWKGLVGMAYAVYDTNTYFVADVNQNIWQLSFTFFQSGAGANIGRYGFKKRMIQGVSVEENGTKLATFSVFPNPAELGTDINLVYNLTDAKVASIAIYDLGGRTIFTKNLNNLVGLSNVTLNTSAMGLQSGIYIVKMNVNGQVGTQKLIIK